MTTNSSVSSKAKIESMEEYSDAKTIKSKPELIIRNSNGNAHYFYSSTKIFKSVVSHTVFGYNKPQINRHMSADVCAASLEN